MEQMAEIKREYRNSHYRFSLCLNSRICPRFFNQVISVHLAQWSAVWEVTRDYICPHASNGSLKGDSQDQMCLSQTWQADEGDILESLEFV